MLLKVRRPRSLPSTGFWFSMWLLTGLLKMGRNRVGPRASSRGGPLQAILKTSEGRFLKESLKTRDIKIAWDRYPAAMVRLQAKARGIVIAPAMPPLKPSDPVTTFVEGAGGDWVERVIPAREVFEPEDFVMSWEQALQLHLRRRSEKTGREPAISPSDR